MFSESYSYIVVSLGRFSRVSSLLKILGRVCYSGLDWTMSIIFLSKRVLCLLITWD